MSPNLPANDAAKAIKLLMLDVDGVLSDGRLYFGNDGSEFKSFSTLDGQGIKMLQASGVKVGIITGAQQPTCSKPRQQPWHQDSQAGTRR